MPGMSESQQDHVQKFENMLNDFASESPGLTVSDLDTMSIVIMIRLRSVFTPDELHHKAHQLIAQCEDWLKEPDALRDQHGNPTSAVLVENFEDREDLIEMMADNAAVTDEDISALLDEETT